MQAKRFKVVSKWKIEKCHPDNVETGHLDIFLKTLFPWFSSKTKFHQNQPGFQEYFNVGRMACTDGMGFY